MTRKRRAISRYKTERVIKERGGICQYCGEAAAVLDHLIPYSFRPDNSEDNLIASCEPCNTAAQNFIFDCFEEKRDFILTVRGVYHENAAEGTEKSTQRSRCPGAAGPGALHAGARATFSDAALTAPAAAARGWEPGYIPRDREADRLDSEGRKREADYAIERINQSLAG